MFVHGKVQPQLVLPHHLKEEIQQSVEFDLILQYIFLILFLTNDIPIAHCYKPFVKVLRIPLNTRPHNKQFAFIVPPFFCLLLTYEIKR